VPPAFYIALALPICFSIMLFTLQTSQARIAVTEYGARLVAIETPDRAGAFGHILLGFDDLAAYRTAGGAFGAVLGRYANRIADARFMLGGKTYLLAPNDSGNILHGGDRGFGNQQWQLESFSEADPPQITFSLVSAAGEEGFPGTLAARAAYRLEANNLTLELTATTDAPTVINLSSHPYFNLGDAARHDILDHEITIDADHYLPTDARQIPTGELRAVTGSVFDFRTPVILGERIRSNEPQLLLARGYDHCFVLNKTARPGPQFAARACSPRSGRVLEIYTTQPGLQFYSGNNLNGAIAGRGGIALRQSAGFAMEAQNFPDAPNRPNFPSPVLFPGEEYRHTIMYKFTTLWPRS
jgi:aldose 1-epimerase